MAELHSPVPKVFSRVVRNGTTMMRIYGPNQNPALPIVIHNHGWPQSYLADDIFRSNRTMLDALVNAGYTIYLPFTGANWGHATTSFPSVGGSAQVAFDDVLLQADADGFDSSAAHFFSVSMGGGNALNWGWRNPSKVRSMYLYAPFVDFAGTYDMPLANTLGVPASMRSVYGVADKTALLIAAASNDPVQNQGPASSIGPKIKALAITNDEVIPYERLTVFLTVIGAEEQTSPGSHFFGGTTNFRDIDMLSWFADHNEELP